MSDHADEIEAIKRNRDDILGEKKVLQRKLETMQTEHAEVIASLEAERTAITERAEVAEKRVADFEINRPVDNFLTENAVDPATFKHVFGEQYKFAVVDGDIAAVTLEGEPVKISNGKNKEKDKLVRLDRKDFESLLYPAENRTPFQNRFGHLFSSKAKGGSAHASNPATGNGELPAAAKPVSGRPAMRFGLGVRHSS